MVHPPSQQYPLHQSSNRLLCSTCVQRALGSVQERHQQARAEWESVRHECSKLPRDEETAHLAELQETSARLRERLEHLKRLSSAAAVEVCAAAVVQDQHEPEQQAVVLGVHERLQAFRQASFVALQGAVDSTQRHVRDLRREWALAAFSMHKLSIDEEALGNYNNNNTKQARGIGKIGGLPLPHAGAELFGVLPTSELQSALRMVASLTSLVAQCLAIVLPHPILLQAPPMSRALEDIAERGTLDENSGIHMSNEVNAKQRATGSESIATLAGRVFATPSSGRFWVPPGTKDATTTDTSSYFSSAPPSMDPSQVQQRLHHSRVAVLQESDTPNSSLYALEAMELGENFAIAWQLLQNDVVALCIRAGVPVSDLWPAQAVLLNLHALQRCCQQGILDESRVDSV